MIRYLFWFLFPFSLHASPSAKYMGSLLSDPPTAIPYGHVVLRSTLFFDDHRGVYDSNWKSSSRPDSYHSYRDQLQGFLGLKEFLDFSFCFQFYLNHQGRYAYMNAGDLSVGLDVQILSAPGIKFAVRELFPLGNYELFNPKRGEMEKTSSGSFATQFALFLYEEFSLSSNWLLSAILQAQYQVSSPVDVKGFHAYGGGFGADGKVWVGNSWQALITMQLFYKSRIFVSLDGLYEHRDASHFYGHPGISFYGTYSDIDEPSSELLSLAPSLGYQFSSHFGMMLGSFFSLCGRNTEQFSQYVANLFYIF